MNKHFMLSLEKFRMAFVADLKYSRIRRTLKKAGEALETELQRSKSLLKPIPSVPDVAQHTIVFLHPNFGHKEENDKTFIKVVSDEDSAERLYFWSTFCLVLGGDLYLWEKDLLKLYGLVVKYYENHHVAGCWIGVMACDLRWLMIIRNVSYPLSVKLMERMLKHKLEIDKDVVGNDMTTAEQLIRFIKNQIAAAQVSPV
ncbi:hypothetical protein Tco_0820007 [Tanacetum coccineum]|uniref:Uncharacterized protein n=1 Tax=Tanacetum coccineum TaxID=301880 RepID=A0ABQ5A975_9ASTR